MGILINYGKDRAWLRVSVTLMLHIVIFILIFLLPLLFLGVYANIRLGDTISTTILVVIAQAVALYLALRILSRWFVPEDADTMPQWYATIVGALFIVGMVIAPSALSAIQALGSTIASYWISKWFIRGRFLSSTDEGVSKKFERFIRIPSLKLPKVFSKKSSVPDPVESQQRSADSTIPRAPAVERRTEASVKQPASQEPAVRAHSSDLHDPDFWKDSEHPTV